MIYAFRLRLIVLAVDIARQWTILAISANLERLIIHGLEPLHAGIARTETEHIVN